MEGPSLVDNTVVHIDGTPEAPVQPDNAEETGIQIAIVDNIVVCDGNPLSSREDDVIAVLGQLLGSPEGLQQMAQQIAPNESDGLKEIESIDEKRPYICECGKSYTCKSHLKYHQKVHANIRPYVCEVCDQGFLQLGHLKRHVRVHTLDKPFTCDICSKSFRQSSHLVCHRRIHTDEKPYLCKVCGTGFRQKSAVVRHLNRKHATEKDFVCSICSKGYSSDADLHRHEKTHVNISYFALLNLQTNTSKICGHIQEDVPLSAEDEPLSNQENKENEESTVDLSMSVTFEDNYLPPPTKTLNSEPRPYICDVCSKTYKTKGHLKFHSKVHLTDRPFKCSFCSKGFLQKGHLRRHVLVHTQEKPYVCNFCSKVFRQVGHLNDHKKIHANVRPHTCYVCCKGFRQSSALKRHMIRMHATKKAYACDICNKHYRLESDMRRHKATMCSKDGPSRKRGARRKKIKSEYQTNRGDELGGEVEGSMKAEISDAGNGQFSPGTDTNEKQRTSNKCEICEKLCRCPAELKLHMRTHTDERPFQCGICHKVFKLTTHLKDHMLIHTGELPFSCAFCNHRFRRESALTRHTVRMHSKAKPHKCSVCDKAYASPVDLRRHQKTHVADHAGLYKNRGPKHARQARKLKRKNRKHRKRTKASSPRHLLADERETDDAKEGNVDSIQQKDISATPVHERDSELLQTDVMDTKSAALQHEHKETLTEVSNVEIIENTAHDSGSAVTQIHIINEYGQVKVLHIDNGCQALELGLKDDTETAQN